MLALFAVVALVGVLMFAFSVALGLVILVVAEVFFARQALHAYRLTLEHPQTAEVLKFETGWPDDMARLRAAPPISVSIAFSTVRWASLTAVRSASEARAVASSATGSACTASAALSA